MDAKKGIRILHVIDSGGMYGAEVMLLNLVAEQLRQGMEPVIASIGAPRCGEKTLETEARHRGLKVETFRMRPGANIVGACKILGFARRIGSDILHSHGYKGNILFGMMPKRLRRIPLVTTLHGWTWSGGWDRMLLYEWLDRLSLRFIDRVVVVNRAMSEMVKFKGLHVVNNGIPITRCDISIISEEEKFQQDPRIEDFCRGGFTIGAIGRLSPEKGFQFLLDAIKELVELNPKVRLVILGEGDERGALEAQIKRLGIEQQVLMPGYVTNAAGRFLPLFKILALSSLTEGLPIVILEAMQAGVPIVATRVGGVPDVLENGKSGVLVDARSSKKLVEGIRILMSDNISAKRMADIAMDLVKTKYSTELMGQRYNEIYEDLLRID
jgi:glycosyltransferase involved in cell wall biosynthesis